MRGMLSHRRDRSGAMLAQTDAVLLEEAVERAPRELRLRGGGGDVAGMRAHQLLEIRSLERIVVLLAQREESVRRRAMAARASDDLVREVLGANDRAAAEHEDALDHVLQVANVAWPGVAREHLERLAVDLHRIASDLARIALDEVIDEGRDVVGAASQRRQLDAHDIDAVVEIGAER